MLPCVLRLRQRCHCARRKECEIADAYVDDGDNKNNDGNGKRDDEYDDEYEHYDDGDDDGEGDDDDDDYGDDYWDDANDGHGSNQCDATHLSSHMPSS